MVFVFYAHAAVESPVRGMRRLANHLSGRKILAELHIDDTPAPDQLKLNSWYVQQIGGAIGMIVPSRFIPPASESRSKHTAP